ncbi:MAG: hypothetical protein RLZZ563_2163, partial [Pseudomonadota bacterium]
MTDVLIIGGGLAGCAAALWLADRGRSVVIVEAQGRLGGRALSRDWGNAGGVEYGGGWLRRDHTRIHALAARLGVAMVPRAPILPQRWFRDGAPARSPAEDRATHDAGMAQLAADAALLAGDNAEARVLQGLTLADYIAHRALPQSVVREVLAWWAISGSGDPEHIAVTEVLTPKLAKGMIAKLEELADTVQGGMSGLVAATAAVSGATVHLGAPVLSVGAGPDGVSATLTDGRVLAARAAIVAVPVNTLGQIRFDPPLSASQQALAERGHAGRAVKLLIRARGVAPGSLATGETAGLRWIYADHILPDGATLLIGFALARDLPAPSEGMVVRALAAAFPEARFEGFDWHDWIADPYA